MLQPKAGLNRISCHCINSCTGCLDAPYSVLVVAPCKTPLTCGERLGDELAAWRIGWRSGSRDWPPQTFDYRVCGCGRALADPAQGLVVGVAWIVKRLADAVDLIVMATVRKAEKLLFETRKPRRLRWEEDLPGFNLSGGDRHSAQFVALGLNRLDGEAFPAQLSNQRRADPAVFDHDLGWSVHVGVSDREPLQAWIVVAASQHVFEVVFAFVHDPGRADGVVVLGAVLRCRIPTLDDFPGVRRQLLGSAKPSPLHHSAARGHGPLLILSRESIRAELGPEFFESPDRLTLGMENLTNLANVNVALAGADPDDLSFLGNRRELENFPFIGRANQIAREVIEVDALHDDDDAAVDLVVEAGQEGVPEPVVGALASAVRERVDGLERVVDDDEVASAAG